MGLSKMAPYSIPLQFVLTWRLVTLIVDLLEELVFKMHLSCVDVPPVFVIIQLNAYVNNKLISKENKQNRKKEQTKTWNFCMELP